MKARVVRIWVAANLLLGMVLARPCSAFQILPKSSKAFSADQRLVFVTVVANSPAQEAQRYQERDEPLLSALVRKYGSEESAQKVLSEKRRAGRNWPQGNQQLPFSKTEHCETAHEILLLRSNYPVSGLYANDTSNRMLWPLKENWDFVSHVIVPNDGKHLIAIEARGTFNRVLAFYEEGKVVRTYSLAQVVDFPSLLAVGAGPSRPWLASFRFDEAKGLLTLHTKVGNRLVFDVRSGRLISPFRPGRMVVISLLLVSVFGIWQLRKWRRARLYRRYHVALVLCTLAVMVLVVLWWPSGEPVPHGSSNGEPVPHGLSNGEPSYHGRTLRDWLRRTESGTSESLAEANEAVRQIGTNALPSLLRMMQSEDSGWGRQPTRWSKQQPLAFLRSNSPTWENRNLAQRGFISLGPIAEPAIPDLINLLDHPKHGDDAQCALAQIGSISVKALTAALTNAIPRVRARAAMALSVISSDAIPAVPALVVALQDSDPEVRAMAAMALGMIQREAALVVPALKQGLADRDEGVRLHSARALAPFGSLAQSAVPSLLAALDDDDLEVMAEVVRSLRCIDRSAAIKAGVYSPPSDVRERVSILVGQAQDTKHTIGRYEAIKALGELAAEPGKVVPAMIALLHDTASFIRAGAAQTLGAYGSHAKAAVPTLLQKMEDQEKYVREAAGWALMQIDPAAAASAGLK